MDKKERVSLTAVERHRRSRAAIIERVCDRVATGQFLAVAAEKERITIETLRRWLAEDDEFQARLRHALELRPLGLSESVLQLADAAGSTPAGLRLRIAARKWWIAQAAKDAAGAEKRMRCTGTRPPGGSIIPSTGRASDESSAR
jgi:hypothetical protein